MKVLVLSKNDLFALHIMRCLSDAKAECHVWGQGMMWAVILSKCCRRYTRCDFGVLENNLDAAVTQINSYCVKHGISHMAAADYETGHLLSRIKTRLDSGVVVFPVAEFSTLEMLENKWTFIQMLRRNNLPHPRTVLAEDFTQLETVDMPFPRVVKSLRCEGGHPTKYLKANKEEYLAAGRNPSDFPLLVQEYIPGADVCFSVLAYKGELAAWTMQKRSDENTLQFFVSEELLDLARRVVTATRYEGVANFDLRIDERDHSAKFIECNPRFWNTLRASRRNGVNFVDLGFMLAEGQPLLPENISKNIRYVIPSYFLAKLFKGKVSVLKDVPAATRRDVVQMFLDPFSLVCSMVSKRL